MTTYLTLSISLVARYDVNPLNAFFDKIEKQTRMLTPQEKATLTPILIEELDPAADCQVDQVWIAESQRRYDVCLHGKLESLPVDEVLSRARHRLN